ncbi:hypothetical protein CLOM621_07447 [Clostridium sp. M62/1]|nr:hypothetical protein CLOM621_07447 [Clostridium sp. M62/1]
MYHRFEKFRKILGLKENTAEKIRHHRTRRTNGEGRPAKTLPLFGSFCGTAFSCTEGAEGWRNTEYRL